jgi:ElaB/YqjD/DUF883 family membrane-anchored ribosome-binding protein
MIAMASQHDDVSNTREQDAAALVEEVVEAPESSPDDRAELDAIGSEIDRIRQSVSHIAEATSHYVRRRVAENSTDLIAENPIRAVLWAAVAGFLIGRLSR